MIYRQRKASIWLLFVIGAAVLFFVVWDKLNQAGWNENFHQLPAQAIYQEVVGRPVPNGVSDLHVIARHFFTKRWIWMHFHATDKTIVSLTNNMNPETVSKSILQGQNFVANHKYDVEDLSAVRWADVWAIAKPRVYELQGGCSNCDMFLWYGDVIVDQKTHTVYIHAGGD